MNIEDINKKAKTFGKNLGELNKKLKNDFEKLGGIDLLTKYVMSEILAPIEDYENFIKIIRTNYHNYLSGKLLIIAAFLAIQWMHTKNEFLDILNCMYSFLPDQEKSLVNYLNAYQIYIKDEEYAFNVNYRNELEKSIKFDVPFVKNFYKLAQISTDEDAKKYYYKALLNVVRILDEQEIVKLKIDDFLNPDFFIGENILGIYISQYDYENIKEKLEHI